MLVIKLTQCLRAWILEPESLGSAPRSVLIALRKLLSLPVTQVPQLQNQVIIVLTQRVTRKINLINFVNYYGFVKKI